MHYLKDYCAKNAKHYDLFKNNTIPVKDYFKRNFVLRETFLSSAQNRLSLRALKTNNFSHLGLFNLPGVVEDYSGQTDKHTHTHPSYRKYYFRPQTPRVIN